MRLFFSALLDLITRASAREAERKERQLEREHSRLLLEGMFLKAIEFTKVNQEAVMALAAAQAAQAEAFNAWIKNFTVQPMADAAPQSASTHEEWVLPDGSPSPQIPAEFKLALDLERLNNESLGDFDREGSDFLTNG